MEGWIKLHRKIVDNPYYFSEPFTRAQAWIDLLIIANHKPGFFYKRGIKVEVKKGQIGWDLESLAKRWRWSRGKVERYINALEIDKQIIRQITNISTLISIVNYEFYQADSKAEKKPSGKPKSEADGQQIAKQTDTNKNEKNDKEEIDVATQPILTDYQLCVDYWLKEFHPGWDFGGQQGKAMNSIIKKIKKIAKEGKTVSETFKYVCQNLSDWYKDKDLAIIDSKFNEVVEEIRNKPKAKKGFVLQFGEN